MRKGSSLVAAIALLAVGAGGARAGSIVIGGGSAIPGSPGVAGLNGSIYQDVANPTGPINPANDNLGLTDLLGFRSAHAVNARYLSTQAATGTIAYSGLDTTATRTFLGSDAANGTFAPSTFNATLNTTLIDLTGYIDVQAAGDYVFTVSSDDALFVLINGQEVVGNGGLQFLTGASGDAQFNAPGLYSFELIYANQDFNNSSGHAALNFTAPAGTTLYASVEPIPLPSSAWGGIALMGGLGVVQLRRRIRHA